MTKCKVLMFQKMTLWQSLACHNWYLPSSVRLILWIYPVGIFFFCLFFCLIRTVVQIVGWSMKIADFSEKNVATLFAVWLYWQLQFLNAIKRNLEQLLLLHPYWMGCEILLFHRTRKIGIRCYHRLAQERKIQKIQNKIKINLKLAFYGKTF